MPFLHASEILKFRSLSSSSPNDARERRAFYRMMSLWSTLEYIYYTTEQLQTFTIRRLLSVKKMLHMNKRWYLSIQMKLELIQVLRHSFRYYRYVWILFQLFINNFYVQLYPPSPNPSI